VSYNPRLDWDLIRTKDMGKEGIVFTFRTIESRETGEYNVSYKMLADRLAKTESDGWAKLQPPNWY
jgi:hypothetical protein